MYFISSIEYVVNKNDQFYFSIQVYKKKRKGGNYFKTANHFKF